LAVCWLQALCLSAQRLETARAVYLREAGKTDKAETYFGFPNINRLSYFEDKGLRRDIAEAQASGDLQKLDLLLTAYVRQFGIQNFRQAGDLQYLWLLGQVKEVRKDTARAMFFYGLALKNQSPIHDTIRVHFDALKVNSTAEFVDLQYYYDIVAARQEIDSLLPPKGVLLNMGKQINSPAPDYAPYMHPAGNVLLFSSRRSHWDEIAPDYTQNEDIYYTIANPFGEGWEPAERLPDAINSPYNEGSACVNTDGTLVFFSRCNAPDGMGVCDLYQAEWLGGKWTNVQNLGPDVNSQEWDSHPFVTADGRALFFCSNRDGGFGGTDLYVCLLQKNGTWGKAENLGPMVNTYYDEVTPYLHPINSTLYFSSKGHLHNRGGFDIFKTRWSGGQWEDPRNLGPLVNTPRDEYYFTIDGKGEVLFLANEMPDSPRNFDLFAFPMPMEARPDAIVKLKGYLIDSLTGSPLTGIVAALDLEKGIETTPVYIGPTGYFEFQLINNRKYLLVVIGENAITIEEELDLAVDSVFSILTQSIIDEQPVVFRQVQFPNNSAEVRPATLKLLEHIGTFLKDHPYCKLLIRGHTDAEGDAEYNLELSRQRAHNIERYILAYSQQPGEMVVGEGYGETRPVFPNDSPEHRARNRRVEFEIVVPEAYRKRFLENEPLAGDIPITSEASGEPIATSPTETPTEATTTPLPTETVSTTPELVTTPPATNPGTAADAEDDFLGEWDDELDEFELDMGDLDLGEIEDGLGEEDLLDISDLAVDVLNDEAESGESSGDDDALDDDDSFPPPAEETPRPAPKKPAGNKPAPNPAPTKPDGR
jgi:outer membrane protein OmpA-like peptidoglycan-associated protein